MQNKISNKILKEGWWGLLRAVFRRAHLLFSLSYLKILRLQFGILSVEAIARFKSIINPTTPLDYSKGEIKITADNLLSFQRSNACSKEPETIQWIEENVKPGDVFYDIGANVGAYSFVVSEFCKEDITIYAFEPSFSTFYQLCKNIILNNKQENIFPFMLCLSEGEQIQVLNYYSVESGESKHTLGDNYIDCLGEEFCPAYKQKILGFSIDSLVKDWGFLPPNHIKLDVDGTELNILRGATNTLKNNTVKSILVEISALDPHKDEIIAFLQQAGFELESRVRHGTSVISNQIFKKVIQ